MVENAQGTATPEGQTAPSASQGTSAAEPASGGTGQPDGAQGTTGEAGTQADEVLFDPAEYESLAKELPENLRRQAEALKKSLQGAFTKKTQAIANQRKDLELVNSFRRNPEATLQQVASQLGYKLTKAQAAAAVDAAGGNEGWNPDQGDPQSWNDVAGFLLNKMREEFGGKLQPIEQEFRSIKRKSFEQQLSEIDPGWEQYEDEMIAELHAHPTLARDPAKLYRVSVPVDVFEARATQRALAKLEGKKQSAQVAGASTHKKMSGLSDEKLSFSQAVEAARKKLAEEGIAPGR
jgi:hypothetical protein